MKKNRYTENQIFAAFKQRDTGAPMAEIRCEHGYGVCRGWAIGTLPRSHEQEAENTCLKRPDADLSLGRASITTVLNRKF